QPTRRRTRRRGARRPAASRASRDAPATAGSGRGRESSDSARPRAGHRLGESGAVPDARRQSGGGPRRDGPGAPGQGYQVPTHSPPDRTTRVTDRTAGHRPLLLLAAPTGTNVDPASGRPRRIVGSPAPRSATRVHDAPRPPRDRHRPEAAAHPQATTGSSPRGDRDVDPRGVPRRRPHDRDADRGRRRPRARAGLPSGGNRRRHRRRRRRSVHGSRRVRPGRARLSDVRRAAGPADRHRARDRVDDRRRGRPGRRRGRRGRRHDRRDGPPGRRPGPVPRPVARGRAPRSRARSRAPEPPAAEHGYLAWLGSGLIAAREIRRRGAATVHLGTPVGVEYTVDAALATSLGPRDDAWREAAVGDSRLAVDVTPWWADAIDARNLLYRALCLMWTEVRWRAPASDAERRVNDEVLRLLGRAFPLDPSLASPWRGRLQPARPPARAP